MARYEVSTNNGTFEVEAACVVPVSDDRTVLLLSEPVSNDLSTPINTDKIVMLVPTSALSYVRLVPEETT